MGYTHAEHARWSEALTALDVAWQRVPAMTERFSLDTMRLRRMTSSDGTVGSADLARKSDTLRYYLALNSGAGLQPGIDMAYHHIARGELDAAVKEQAARSAGKGCACSGSPQRPTARRAEIIDRALALPLDQGIDADSMWTALGLAVRERRDPGPYAAAVREYQDENAEKVLAFITAVRSSANPAKPSSCSTDCPSKARGQAYSAALVILGARAPAQWRNAADRLLFVPERPYFSYSRSGT